MDIKLLKTYLANSWNQILNPNFSLKSLANLLEVVRLVFSLIDRPCQSVTNIPYSDLIIKFYLWQYFFY